MYIYLGTTGLDQTFQKEFPETMECNNCGGEARIMFVAAEEGGEEKYVASLHKNKGKGGYWFHDACAAAVYLCRDCFKASAIVNQG